MRTWASMLAVTVAVFGCSSGGATSDAGAMVPAGDAGGATDTGLLVDAGSHPTDGAVADIPGAPVDGGTGGGADAGPSNPLVAARPYNFLAPSTYVRGTPTPLIILLHGYSASGRVQDLYVGLSRLVESRGFLYAYPDGTRDATGNLFWNATDACCDFGHVPVDDVAYITAIIDDVSAHYTVDPRRIFVVGHSNGGFMSHRMACDLSTRVAAIVSLAGATWIDQTHCTPTAPVNILEVHGDADTVISYTGGTAAALPGVAMYPGARTTVADWARLEGCDSTITDTGMTLDLESTLPGAETRVERYGNCHGGSVDLWTIHGGSHIPTFQPTWAQTLYDYLMAHPRM